MMREPLVDFLRQYKQKTTSRFGETRIGRFCKKIFLRGTICSKGFTLVEMAVVLVIVGAIYMSVLKVESMVRNAKIRQLFSQYRELRTAILVYKDKYGYLPGDDPYAVAHVGASRANPVNAGGGDGRIDFNPPTNVHENNYLFEHLTKAGLIKGNHMGIYYAADTFYAQNPMVHPFASTKLPQYSSVLVYYYSTPNSNVIEFSNLPYDVAQAFDQAFDDGIYNKGNVRSYFDYTAAATATPANANSFAGSAYYTNITFN